MPAWWRGKSKTKLKPKTNTAPSLRTNGDDEAAAGTVEEECSTTPRKGRVGKKDKVRSFDEAVGFRPREPSPLGGRASPCGPGHPLPLPKELPPHDLVSAAASVSSVSSSGSSDETPDIGFCRHADPINMSRDRHVKIDPHRPQHLTEERKIFVCSPVREHARCLGISIPPRREFQQYGFDGSGGTTPSHCGPPTEPIFNPRTPSCTTASRGCPFPTSPTRRQDDLRSPPHPLPLPRSSPSSSSACSLQSQWKKGKLLGRGTFGHVYQGFNSESGQMCAIKEVTLISDDSNSRECLKQLSQEITMLSNLSHPNIVRYYGSEPVEDTLSVYLEYVSGGSIHKLLQEYGPFGEPVIRSYTAQILSGLAYLHARNAVHRDIKGANILVDPNGDIKLADFGMAKHMSPYNSIRSFKGSPYWMAPEVIMNGCGYNLSVDIWSLGCTVLEMATSKPPWSQFEGVAAIFKIGNSKDLPEIPDHLSSDGKNFLKLCLQRDPSARPTAVQLMEHPFIRDQATTKVSKFNLFRETMLSTSERSHKMTTVEFPSNRRSISPLHERDHGMRLTVGLLSPNRSPSDLVGMRTNMSLPASPCSSPLRQFKQSNWSCLPSPPHPAYSAGAINYSPSNYSLYPTRPSNNYQDPWPGIPQLKGQTPYGSPRR